MVLAGILDQPLDGVSLQQCLEACYQVTSRRYLSIELFSLQSQDRFGFTCGSAMYFANMQFCALTSETASGRPELFGPDSEAGRRLEALHEPHFAYRLLRIEARM